MAIHTRNRTLTVNAVDLTSWVKSIEVTESTSTQEITTTGATNKTYSLGLPDFTLTATLLNSYAVAEVWLTLNTVLGDSSGVTVTAVPTNGSTVGQVSGTFILESLTHISAGEVDDVDEITVVFRPAGTITVSTT